jgi:hypothetical protein
MNEQEKSNNFANIPDFTYFCLISTDPVAGFGSCFPSLAAARNEATRLQTLDLCKSYVVTQHTKAGSEIIYNSHKEYQNDQNQQS